MKKIAPLLFFLLCFMAAAQHPQRIISGAPNFTEILFALELGERLVAVTDFCKYPPEAMRKEKIGGYINPNMEKIISLHPDLVIIPKTKSELPRKLTRLNIHVLELPNESVADVLHAVAAIAERCGVPAMGTHLKTQMENELSQLQSRFADKPKVRTLLVVSRAPDSLKDIYAAASGTFLDELLNIAGGENVFAKQPALYPKISRESLIAFNPDVILDMTFFNTTHTTDTMQTALKPWYDLTVINAVKHRRVYLITDPSLTIQGARLPQSARLIADLIHKNEEDKP